MFLPDFASTLAFFEFLRTPNHWDAAAATDQVLGVLFVCSGVWTWTWHQHFCIVIMLIYTSCFISSGLSITLPSILHGHSVYEGLDTMAIRPIRDPQAQSSLGLPVPIADSHILPFHSMSGFFVFHFLARCVCQFGALRSEMNLTTKTYAYAFCLPLAGMPKPVGCDFAI